MSNKKAHNRRQGRSKETILAAARALVVEGGAEKFSLREVARRAGYSPSSLYEYFDGKDDLIRALSERVAARLTERLAKIPLTLAPRRRLVRYGQVYVGFARDLPEDFLLLFLHLRSRRMAHSQPVSGGSPYALVLKAAVDGIAEGSIEPGPGGAEGIAYGLWAVAHGLAMLQLTHLKGYEIDFEEADRLTIETWVAGLPGA